MSHRESESNKELPSEDSKNTSRTAAKILFLEYRSSQRAEVESVLAEHEITRESAQEQITAFFCNLEGSPKYPNRIKPIILNSPAFYDLVAIVLLAHNSHTYKIQPQKIRFNRRELAVIGLLLDAENRTMTIKDLVKKTGYSQGSITESAGELLDDKLKGGGVSIEKNKGSYTLRML